MNKILKKALLFTDIHFGRRSNSEMHNKDCYAFVVWIYEQVKKDPTIDHIIFCGDWHEQRNAINGMTLDYSYKAAKTLSQLGIPVFFIVGNHDLYFRNNRNIFTTTPFESLDNFTIIDKVTVVENMGKRGAVISPFLFEDEFPQLLGYVEYPVVFGHFEFKDFVITGDTVVKEHGPDHKLYKSFKRIFSGHYHKRQIKDNVVYIGSTFPMDFSDANDVNRGVGIYEYDTDKLSFIDWPNCPSYVNSKLSVILDDPKKYLKKDATVRCLVDIELNHEESIELKSQLTKRYKLREITLDEGFNLNDMLGGDTALDENDLTVNTVDYVIEEKLKTISVDKIDNNELIKIYKEIKL